jgi:TfoX/Sxy family transcriptional regulator of competence genes
MAYDEGLAERIREVLDGRPAVTEKKMFGGLAFMLDGYMFVGVQDDTLMARVGPDNHAAALARPGARPMDFTGRPMKGYVYVDPKGFESDEDLAGWIKQCAAFVKTLPPK